MQSQAIHTVDVPCAHAFINEWTAPHADAPRDESETDRLVQWAELVSPHVLVLNLE